jgi:hypothetical protein
VSEGQCCPSHPRLCPQYATERCSCCCKCIQQRMLFAICYSIGVHLCRLAFAASIWPGQSAATKARQLRHLIVLNCAIADVSSPPRLRCRNKRLRLRLWKDLDRKVISLTCSDLELQAAPQVGLVLLTRSCPCGFACDAPLSIHSKIWSQTETPEIVNRHNFAVVYSYS